MRTHCEYWTRDRWMGRLLVACLAVVASLLSTARASSAEPCRVEIVDAENGWPVPLVELRTTHEMRLVSDNAGLIAIDQPELLGREVWFHVIGHGYEVPADGFGYRGVRLKPESGKSLRIKVRRTMIARRLGRLTGTGLFAESQKLGEMLDWQESGLVGCDSVMNAEYQGRHFWLWGDTTLFRYPLGVFNSTSATSASRPLTKFEPPVRIDFDYFRDERGEPRGVARMPGSGPTWLTCYTTVPDDDGRERLVATYSKIRPPLEAYESGLCVWNDERREFERLKVIWSKSDDTPKPPPLPEGHPARWKDDAGDEWLLFGNPLPRLRCRATFSAWSAPAQWESLEPQTELQSAGESSDTVKPHSGSIAWNAYRKRWVTVFMQHFGKPSAFGELWYAESDSPFGPWGPAVKVLSHDNYTFYNPRLHPEFTPADSPVLLFE
ncbi:MAG: hypothetical protein R3C99_28255, partial [Pirellulaceae bacterium]